MKLSISLPDEDVALLDQHARRCGLQSRSAAVQQAVRLLCHPDLEQEYSNAWEEWTETGERAAWEPTTADGLDHPAR